MWSENVICSKSPGVIKNWIEYKHCLYHEVPSVNCCRMISKSGQGLGGIGIKEIVIV
jgi:hypothetical protein